MKNLFTILFVFFLFSVRANNYYFSSVSGDDSRSVAQAQNASTPWKTLGKLNSFFNSLQPGDAVLLKRGETFYGSITISKSGTSASPITIGAYGSGNKPVITSLVTLGNWVSKGNGIWESYNPSLGATVNNVLINNTAQQIGRYPNSDAANKGYLTLESHTSNSITDNQLKSSPNWTGAEVVIRVRRWVTDRCPITKHSGQKITYTRASNYSANDDFGYFIQNDIKTLDKFGEWYYNKSTKKVSIFFGANTPSSYFIQATALDNLINSPNYDNLVFDNLNVKGANKDGFNFSHNSNINIQNCDIAFSGESGITATFNTDFKIENSTIANSNNDGLDLGYGGDHSTIRNNKITNTSIFSGMGESGDGKGFAIQSNGSNSVIEHNEILNTGYVAINFNGDNTIVKNNFVDGFCLTKDDGSAIYTFEGSSDNNRTGRKVIGNIVINGIGVPEGVNDKVFLAEGIYLDDNASGVEISGNTVSNVPSKGIFLHNARNVIVSNNTLYNNKVNLSFLHNSKGDPIRKCTITHNIFFLKSAAEKSIVFISDANDATQLGRIDSNYYARPADDESASFLKKVHVYEPKAKVVNYNSSVNYAFNSSLDNKTITLDGDYKDVKNKSYSNSAFLNQFTSLVLIKNGSGTNGSPTVSLTSPAQNASYNSPATIDISADASDANGSISKVEFYNGTTLLNTQSSAPYIYNWSNVSNGSYTITAKATDNDGNVTTSESVTISVSSSSFPTVSLTSPSQNASYNSPATINISADASDTDGSVSKVEFYNGANLLRTETGRPYTWDWSNVAAGSYTITAKATDNDGNVTTSESVTISVSSSSFPTVSLTSPAQNTSYNSPATINISADASDTDGSISKVEFYNGTDLLRTETTSPYTWDWSNVAAGTYTITAKATDNDGNVTTSESVTISVSSENSPVVSLTSPKQNASYTARATISISADASSSNGKIEKVEFYNGTTLLHIETGSPYIWDWRNVGAGNYTLTAKAIDNNGNETTSESVTISVKNSGNTSDSNNNDVIIVDSSNVTNTTAARAQVQKNSSKDNGFSYTMKVFPNPAVNTIQINLAGLKTSNEKANVFVQSLSGIMFKNIPVILSGKTIEADVSSLTTGVYIVTVVSDNFKMSKKFIKN